MTLSSAVTAAALSSALPTSPGGPTPAAVAVCVVILVCYLASRSARVVLPGESLVIGDRHGERVTGHGLRLVAPYGVRTRTVPSRIVVRDVVARGTAAGAGGTTDARRCATVSVLVSVLVAAGRDMEESERDIDVATRRALHRIGGHGPTPAGRVTHGFRRSLASELSRRGHTLVDATPEDGSLPASPSAPSAPEPAPSPTVGPAPEPHSSRHVDRLTCQDRPRWGTIADGAGSVPMCDEGCDRHDSALPTAHGRHRVGSRELAIGGDVPPRPEQRHVRGARSGGHPCPA